MKITHVSPKTTEGLILSSTLNVQADKIGRHVWNFYLPIGVGQHDVDALALTYDDGTIGTAPINKTVRVCGGDTLSVTATLEK